MLIFTLVYPVIGFDWLWLALALLADIGVWVAGGYRNRRRLTS